MLSCPLTEAIGGERHDKTPLLFVQKESPGIDGRGRSIKEAADRAAKGASSFSIHQKGSTIWCKNRGEGASLV